MNTDNTNPATSPSPPKLTVVPPSLLNVPKPETTTRQPEIPLKDKISSEQPTIKSNKEEKTLQDASVEKGKNKGLMVGAIALSLLGIGFIPMGQKAKSPYVISSAPGQRQTITLPQGMVIEQLRKRHNQTVKAGEVVVKLSDEQLHQQKIDIEQELAAAKSEYNLAEQTYKVNTILLQQIQVNADSANRRALERKQDINLINQGSLPEKLSEFEHLISASKNEIAGLEGQLNILNSRINSREYLLTQGAFSRDGLAEFYSQREALKSQIDAKRSQINQIQAKLQMGKQQLVDEYSERMDVAQEKNIAVATAQQNIQVAMAGMDKWKKQIGEVERQKINSQQKESVLEKAAPFDALVIAPDLDKLQGQRLTESKEIQLVNVNNLPGTVLVEEYYASSIKPGMRVTCVPEGQQREYKARVHEVGQPEFDQTQQKRLVPVQIIFNDADAKFVLGTSGKATIYIKETRLYELIFSEVYKNLNPLINYLR